MSTAIMEQPSSSVAIPQSTLERISELVAEASLIPKDITNEVQATMANELHASMQETRRVIEKTRKTLKEPYIKMSRQIDEAAESATKDLVPEEQRLSRALGDYYALIEAKKRAQAKLESAETEVDKMRAGLLVNAATLTEFDELGQQFSEENRAKQGEIVKTDTKPSPSIKKDYDIVVTDIWLLAKAHPACVKIEPRIGEIKELVRNGVKVAGINATEVNKIR